MRPARTRFAPSPTGELHIGNARTALFNWLFARHSGGTFVLRIEDTDIARSDAAHEKSLIDDLRWLGLSWDEGPDKGGPRGAYRQSERSDLYNEQAARLVDKGLAYRCACSRERLASLKAEQVKKGIPPRYDNRCRSLGVKAAPAAVLRYALPGRAITLDDGVHGEVSFDTSVMGDFVIIGSDSMPSYNFAVVVDDALMGISHVLRGDDHLSNTPRQLMLFASLGFDAPRYYHLPLVLSHDKTPLSKRDAASSVRSLREEGFLPEAVVNTMARLGWSPGPDAPLTLSGMAAAFDGKKLSKSPSIFDLDRLKSYNKEAIATASAQELLSLANIERTPEAVVAAEAVKATAATIAEFAGLIAPFAGDAPEPDAEARAALAQEGAAEVLTSLMEAVKGAGDIDEEAYEWIMARVKSATGAKARALFMPIRAALTGRVTGIELVNVFRLLGGERIITRLKRHSG